MLNEFLNEDSATLLADLPNLQRCYLRCGLELAGGPWLASLRWLSTDFDSLVSSTAALQDATVLESVEVGGWGWTEGDSQPSAAMFDWLAQHPPLCRVVFDVDKSAATSKTFVSAVQRLRSRRPDLQVQCTGLDNTVKTFLKSI